ncbi:MAG: TRAP transporter small permease [Candidatus Aerophobetes bacterium]|nr:TRAP transporter small permease [Candidatus Aerophobetes bacterium]
MKNIKNISKKIFDLLEVHLAAVIFLILFFCIVIQVFSRYVFNSPLPPLFELSIYSFVWVIYLGAPLAKRYRKHIRFDILYRKLPKRVQLITEIAFDLLLNVVLLIISVPIIRYVAWSYKIKTSVLRIPWSYLLLCFPIFTVLLFIHNSVWIYYHIREFLGKRTPPSEVPPWQ